MNSENKSQENRNINIDLNSKFNDPKYFLEKKYIKNIQSKKEEINFSEKDLPTYKETEKDENKRDENQMNCLMRNLDFWDSENTINKPYNAIHSFKGLITSSINTLKERRDIGSKKKLETLNTIKTQERHEKEYMDKINAEEMELMERQKAMEKERDILQSEKKRIKISDSPEKSNVVDFLERDDYDQICIILRNITIFRQKFDFNIFLPEKKIKKDYENNQTPELTLEKYDNFSFKNENNNNNLSNLNEKKDNQKKNSIGINNFSTTKMSENSGFFNFNTHQNITNEQNNRLNTNYSNNNKNILIENDYNIDSKKKNSSKLNISEMDSQDNFRKLNTTKSRFKINYQTNLDTISNLKSDSNVNYINKKFFNSKISKNGEDSISNYNKTESGSVFSIIKRNITNPRENVDSKSFNSLKDKKITMSNSKLNLIGSFKENDEKNKTISGSNKNFPEKMYHTDRFSFLNRLDGKLKYYLIILEKYSKIENSEMFRKLDTIEYYKIVLHKKIENENIFKTE